MTIRTLTHAEALVLMSKEDADMLPYRIIEFINARIAELKGGPVKLANNERGHANAN